MEQENPRSHPTRAVRVGGSTWGRWQRLGGVALVGGLGLAGCAQFAPGAWAPGTPIAQVRAGFIKPSAEFALPGGGTRLEYPEGSFGRQTYMLDFDAQGRLVSSQQVLTEPNFEAITPGMSEQDVSFRLGQPAQVFPIGWQNRQVWNYRWFGGDCVWYQISFDNRTHRVVDSGVGQDPACDVKSRD